MEKYSEDSMCLQKFYNLYRLRCVILTGKPGLAKFVQWTWKQYDEIVITVKWLSTGGIERDTV